MLVEEAVSEHVETDSRDVEAENEERELLALWAGEREQVLGEGEDLGCGDEVGGLHQAEDAHPPEVGAGVSPLEPDGLPMIPVSGAVHCSGGELAVNGP